MSLLHQQRQQTQMLPAGQPVQITTQGKSGCLSGPPKTPDVEAQMAQQAHQKIQTRLLMAKSFQHYLHKAQPNFNKYDVTVTSDPVSTEERICLTVYENKKVVPLTVKNSGVTTVYLTFWTVDFVQNVFTVREWKRHGNVIRAVKKHALEPGAIYKMKVHFHSKHAGFFEQLQFFKFETCQQCSDNFYIVRLLEVLHLTSLSEENLPTKTKSLCNQQLEMLLTAGGKESEKSKSLIPVVLLKRYGIPDSIKECRISNMVLQKPLTWKNYSRRFHLLLHLEELHLKTVIEKYNKNDVPLFRHKSNKNIFILQIADLPEGSSVHLAGSKALVTFVDLSEGYEKTSMFASWVLLVDAGLVYLRFCKNYTCDFKENMRVSVDFFIDRLPLRIQHRAVERVYKHKLREILFPTGQLSSQQPVLQSLVETEANPEQQTAIQHIVACSAKPAPYLVFGPPGTGKTVTLVEAIKQIVKTHSSCNILACAPSNSAADHLCEKMLEKAIDKKEVYRFYALSCTVRNIPKMQKFYCNLNHTTNTLNTPPKEELMKYKIMVTTLITAGRLFSGGIPVDHYHYIFVDEAGQATETESIIPIAGLMKLKSCQVVLAGDPKQLGPIIQSRMAVKHGLGENCIYLSDINTGMPLLERLMTENKLYKSNETNGYNNRFVTKLLRNYRSHPAILKIPNELFYEGQLKAFAHKEKRSLYCKWECLPKKGFPLIFHGVAGTEERECNSPSFYNTAEIEVLKEYVKALVDHLHKKGVTKIDPSEIGIIAPYRKQVAKIQRALKTDKDLKKEDLENVLVGTVEKFQGQEFNVILVSTVRSIPKLTAKNQRFTLGFVNDEKRFNVAMTRAKALLIVVGDPRVLTTNKIWNKFIHYCYKEGGYRGITIFDAEEEEQMLTTVHSPNVCEE